MRRLFARRREIAQLRLARAQFHAAAAHTDYQTAQLLHEAATLERTSARKRAAMTEIACAFAGAQRDEN